MAETLEQHQARISRESAEFDSYVEWCDARGLDPDEDHWESFRVEERERYEDWLESIAEDRAAGF